MSNENTINRVSAGIYQFNYTSRYELCAAFMRLQEFYESPNPGIRGHFFTHEEIMDEYAFNNPVAMNGRKNKFTYFQEWAGFNVPGKVVAEFLALFSIMEMWEKEKRIFVWLRENAPEFWSGNYYVIGTSNEDSPRATLNHEMAHAYFSLFPEYKKDVLDLIYKLVDKQTIEIVKKWIAASGYTEDVIEDELQAYLTTSTQSWLTKRTKSPIVVPEAIRKFYKNFRQEANGKSHV